MPPETLPDIEGTFRLILDNISDLVAMLDTSGKRSTTIRPTTRYLEAGT